MKRGYTKSYRKELDSDIWLMPPLYHRVWIWLKTKAKWQREVFPTPNGMGIHINPGQLITSYDIIANGVKWHEWGKEKSPNKKTIKTIMDWLAFQDMVTVVSNGKGTFISIVNWGIYQDAADKKVTVESNEDRVTEKRLPETIKELQEKLKELQELNKKPKKKTVRFTPPSIPEVKAYCLERKNKIDPEYFIDFYSSKGWMVGKNKMKDWKASIRTWEKKDNGTSKKSNGRGNGFAEARPAGKTDWLS